VVDAKEGAALSTPFPLLFLGKLLQGATSRFADLEKLSLNFSSSSFAIRVNLL